MEREDPASVHSAPHCGYLAPHQEPAYQLPLFFAVTEKLVIF